MKARALFAGAAGAAVLWAGCTGARPGAVPPAWTASPAIEASGTLLLVPGATSYVSIRVQLPGRTPTPVAYATVWVNGTPVPYVPTATAYEAPYTGPAATGDAVALALSVPGVYSGGATALVPPPVPAIQFPPWGSVHGVRTPLAVTWATPAPGASYLAVDAANTVKCAAVARGLTAPIAILEPTLGGTLLPAFTFCLPTPAPGVSPTPEPVTIYVATARGAPIPGTGQADPLGRLLHIQDQWVVVRVGPFAFSPIGLVP